MADTNAQLELITDDGISDRYLEYFNESDKPDYLGRRSFFLIWNDRRAFAPGASRNADGSTTRGQAFFANPNKYIDQGYAVRPLTKRSL